MVQTAELTLTQDQIAGIEFLNNAGRFSLIKGSAGTGKTTLVREFAKRKSSVIATAPTHKAVNVLSGKLKCPSKTIHSYLGLKRKLVKHKYEYQFDPTHTFEFYDHLIIDESSMLNSYQLKIIMEYVPKKTKIIFVGDGKQLNPVGETNSPVFYSNIPEFELTDIIRHQNDIIDLSRNLDWLSSKKDGECFKWFELNNVPLQLLVDANGTDSAKFITWTNKTVGIINKVVRNQIYNNPGQFMKGETILMLEPCGPYKNNEEVRVNTIQDSHKLLTDFIVPHNYLSCWKINDEIFCIKDEDLPKHKENLKFLKDQCISKVMSWHKYYRYVESFGQYQYNHAVTVHKSQGSTYETSIVNISEIKRNRQDVEKQRMLYTAITRASKMNYLI